MKLSSLFIVLLASIVASCAYSQRPSSNALEGFTRIDIAYRALPSDHPEEFAKIGRVFAAYMKLDTQYVALFGETKTLVAEVIYCAELGGRVLILGKVTKDGAFDSKGKPIEVFADTIAGQIIGISGDIVETPFLPCLVLQDGNDVWETESVISIGIDAKKKTIYSYTPTLE